MIFSDQRTAFSFVFEYNTCVLCSAGVGMRTGTTITCRSTMVTFSGKKCVIFPPRLLRHLSCALIIVRLQPGKPRKSEGWEKIYVAAFGAGALSTYLPLVVIFLFFQHMNGLFGNLFLNDLQLPWFLEWDWIWSRALRGRNLIINCRVLLPKRGLTIYWAYSK